MLNEIEKHSSVFKKINSEEYRIRCPICGDSQKNLKDAHCYLKCSLKLDEPILYNCFLCNSHGAINKQFLDNLGIDNKFDEILNKQKYNRLMSLKNNKNIELGDISLIKYQMKYLEHRLGKGLNINDFLLFRIVCDINILKDYITEDRIKHILPNNDTSISFLSDDNSLLLNRAFYENMGYRWKKIKLFENDMQSFYTIKTTVDLFNKLILNIAEGIIDVISIYKNFKTDNDVFIATLGSDYISGIDYAIAKGILGENVILNIYIDNDINEKNLKFKLKKYRWMFKDIYICKNLLSKDVGVKIDEIQLVKIKI